jgi:thiamine biosynthesis lipoprotein ApbE
MCSRAGLEESPAAVADALSTAFMISPVEDIDRYCWGHPGLEAWILEGELRHFPMPGIPDREARIESRTH